VCRGPPGLGEDAATIISKAVRRCGFDDGGLGPGALEAEGGGGRPTAMGDLGFHGLCSSEFGMGRIVVCGPTTERALASFSMDAEATAMRSQTRTFLGGRIIYCT
jgi:hypothetical protein